MTVTGETHAYQCPRLAGAPPAIAGTETPKERTMKWIVRRNHDGNEAWTGPMDTLAHAERERDAWISAGRPAEVVEYTPDVAGRCRRWDRGLERIPFEVNA